MPLPTVKIELKQYVNNTIIRIQVQSALIDSGAEVSLISATMLDLRPFSAETISPLSLLNAANNQMATIHESITANITVDGQNKEFPLRRLLVVPHRLLFPVIIGYDLLKGLNLLFPTSLDTVQFNNFTIKPTIPKLVEIFETKTTFPVHNTFCKKPVFLLKNIAQIILSPFQHAHIRFELEMVENNDVVTTDLIIPSEKMRENGLILLDNFNKQTKTIKIVNSTAHVIIIHPRAVIATDNPAAGDIIHVNTLITINELKPDDRKIHEEDVQKWKIRRQQLCQKINIDQELKSVVEKAPTKFQQIFEKILYDYKNIFARTDGDVGLSRNFVVDLRLKNPENKETCFARPYKTDGKLRDELDKKVSDMIQAGVLEETISCWNSPTMLIKRTGNKFRLITNYKQLVNPKLSVPNWPILPIRQILSKIGQHLQELKNEFPSEEIFMFSTDIRNAFYTLAITNSSRDITSFIANARQVRYKRCSMGLNVSPSCFSRFVYEVFKKFECKGARLSTYLDDSILICVESCVDIALRAYLDRLQSNHVTLGLNKCVWFQKELMFLGHIISPSGVKSCPKKHTSLIQLPYPKTHKEAMRFAGSMVFYSRLNPKLALLLQPLYKQIAKGPKNYELTEFVKRGIDVLRHHMERGNFTTHLDYTNQNNRVIVYVADSSIYGVGFAVGNATKIGDYFTDISLSAYGSRSFDEVVKMQSSRSRELCGFSYGLDDFADILHTGLEIYGFIDHASLERCEQNASMGKTSTNTRVRRAMATILNFPKLKICFVPNKNTLIEVCDGISRALPSMGYLDGPQLSEYLKPKLPALTINAAQISYKTVQPRIELSKIISEQQKCDFLKPIVTELNHNPSQVIEHQKKRYIMSKNGLVKQLTSENVGLIFIPPRIAFEIVDYLHQISAHTGRSKLKSMLHEAQVLIPNKTKILQDISQSCLLCQFVNKSKETPKMPYQMRPSLAPFTEISVDLMDISGMNSTYRFIMTFYCKFSRFLATRLLTNKTADNCAKNLVILIHQFQLQQTAHLTTDNGKEWDNETFRNTLDALGISFSKISSYNSRSSAVERSHRSLRYIMRNCPIKDLDIRSKVEICTATYNSTPTEPLGYKSPFSVIYGTPEKNFLGYMQDTDRNSLLATLPENQRPVKISEWYNYLQQHHQLGAATQLERYLHVLDENEDVFESGDLVLTFDPVIQLGKTIGTCGRGPYKVLKRHLSAFQLQHCITGARCIRNRRFLRKLKLKPDLQDALIKNEFLVHSTNEIRLLKDIPDPGVFNIQFEDEVEANVQSNIPAVKSSVEQNENVEKSPKNDSSDSLSPHAEPHADSLAQHTDTQTPTIKQISIPTNSHYNLRNRKKVNYKN